MRVDRAVQIRLLSAQEGWGSVSALLGNVSPEGTGGGSSYSSCTLPSARGISREFTAGLQQGREFGTQALQKRSLEKSTELIM